ncbi:MAG: PHP domain-containing protein [Phycisphaerales bacterium]|nr:PHP domain-containing protein [Phycisphaerales bacterium]
MERIKAVFHIHSDYSDDSNLSVERICQLARDNGIGCLALTDHDTIEGARRLAELAGPDLQVIVGQEISTNSGHLIGLFLERKVEPGQSPRKTAEAVRRQGGLVVAPHPFNILFGCSLGRHAREIVDLIDIVEIQNAQNLLPIANWRAEDFARRVRRPAIVGCDVHHGDRIDACHFRIPDFEGPQGFLDALPQAILVKGRHSLNYFAKTAWLLLRSHLGFGVPPCYGRNCSFDRAASVPVRQSP